MYRLATKLREKTNRRKRERDFLDRQSGVHSSCYVLLFTDFVNCGQSRLRGLSLGAFTNSTRWAGSCVPTVRQLVTETGSKLTACHYKLAQYNRLPEQQLEFLVQPRRNVIKRFSWVYHYLLYFALKLKAPHFTALKSVDAIHAETKKQQRRKEYYTLSRSRSGSAPNV